MTETDTQCVLTLKRFSHENANLVLSWRNQDHVRANSLNDAEITLVDHLSFVDSLGGQDRRNYFLVQVNGNSEAVLNVNVDGSEGLWGCYIGTQEMRPGLFPMLAAISGSLAFDTYNCAILRSEVLASNMAPQKLNKFLGVPMTGTRQEHRSSNEAVDVSLYTVLKDDWPNIRARIDKIVTRAQREALFTFDTNPSAAIV